MDDLQYLTMETGQSLLERVCFKPCYKWMTFNTNQIERQRKIHLVRFKPCYKWMTFNTEAKRILKDMDTVKF